MSSGKAEATIRAFVAVELPPEVRDALSEVVRFLDGIGIGGMRTVEPGSAHLTLKFLGDVEASRVGAVEEALAGAAAASRPFRLALAGTGTFPERGTPRVLWAGLDGDLDALTCLQARVEEALGALGFAPEGRPFRLHLTLARLGDRSARGERRRAAAALSSAPFEPGFGFGVESVSLMRSVLRPGGARYVRLASVRLMDGG